MSVAAALALGPACSASHERDRDPMPMPDASTGPDARVVDTGLADAGHDAGHDAGRDAGGCEEIEWTGSCCEPMPPECCLGYWDEAGACCVTCVEGPMAPPSAPV